MKFKEIIKTKKFNEFLAKGIEKYNNRPALSKGLKYVRTAYDALKDQGKFDVISLKEEFEKISNKESSLPVSQRAAIEIMVFYAVLSTEDFRKKAKKKRQEKQAVATKKEKEIAI